VCSLDDRKRMCSLEEEECLIWRKRSVRLVRKECVLDVR
jgi:hypothetical protein